MKSRPSRVRAIYNDARLTLKHKPRVAIVYILLRFLVILTIIAQFFNRNYENVFLKYVPVPADPDPVPAAHRL